MTWGEGPTGPCEARTKFTPVVIVMVVVGSGQPVFGEG